ncbi:signal peptidase I [Microbacterium sp. B19]|uniref:signal peptidase I n=1 Tax=Microbacterium sp. B19 TaxID=96765 RepID=UPI000349C6C8|nr:signal peptidase I [Microbacterium sp. B19]
MTTTASTPARRDRWRRISRSPLAHLLLAVIVLALVQTFVIKPFQVPSESMSPTLESGDRIIASRVAFGLASPGPGDVVVFARPDTWGPAPERGVLRTAVGWIGDIVGFGPSNQDALVKRIIGVPGSTVRCCSAQGQLEVDGQPLAEGYVFNDLPFTPGVNDCTTTPVSPRCFAPVLVPSGEYLVMGDNRANSADSVIACRGGPATAPDCARFVPRDDMIGVVVAIVWPLNRARVVAPG